MAHILVIDDDDSLRLTLAQWLTAAGHTTSAAADGLEGLELFRAAPADVVLMDMMMPHSGLIAIRVLREQYPDIKVIAMTGGAQRRLGYASDLGACCTLTKPFTPAQLTAAIARALAVWPISRTLAP